MTIDPQALHVLAVVVRRPLGVWFGWSLEPDQIPLNRSAAVRTPPSRLARAALKNPCLRRGELPPWPSRSGPTDPLTPTGSARQNDGVDKTTAARFGCVQQSLWTLSNALATWNGRKACVCYQ